MCAPTVKHNPSVHLRCVERKWGDRAKDDKEGRTAECPFMSDNCHLDLKSFNKGRTMFQSDVPVAVDN